jgi:parvulin-like peptidyl-prolyl isomerase
MRQVLKKTFDIVYSVPYVTTIMRTDYRLWAIFYGLLVVAVPGCHKKPVAEKEIVLARVNTATLTQRDLEKDLLEGYQNNIAKQQKLDLVRRWVDDELLYQEALRLRMDLDQDIEHDLNRLKRDFLVEKLLEQKLEHRIVISDEEIKQYYQANARRLTLDQPMVRPQLILVKTQPEAQAIKAKLKNGASFGALAKQYSIDPSAEIEGDMGYLTKWDLDTLLAQACFALKVKEVSPVLKTASGYHIIKILDLKEKGESQPLPLVHEQIVNAIDKKKKKESLRLLINELRDRSAVAVNFAALDTGEFPLAQGQPAMAADSSETEMNIHQFKQGEDSSHVLN